MILENENIYQEHQHIFSCENINIASYTESLELAKNHVLDFLKKRSNPIENISVVNSWNKIQKINLDNHKTINLKECLGELWDLYTKHTTAFHHRHYMAHLNCPVVIPALAAEVLISALNTSMDTWDQSFGGTHIEMHIVNWMLEKLGFSKEKGDGVFTSGGSQSNLMGLLLAREAYITKNKLENNKLGIEKRFRIFCSELSHFSLFKGVKMLGLGTDALVNVAVDKHFRLDVAALQQSILEEQARGNIPIAIVATAGTTNFGSIDPIPRIAKIAKKLSLWLHVDAAYGGGLLMSENQRNKLSGIDQANSVTIDFHKTFFQPISSSAFFVQDKENMNFVQYYADYLNPKEQQEEGIPNLVSKSIQTTRRFDALKLWVALRTLGINTLGSYIDQINALALETYDYLLKKDDFEVLNKPEISTIMFRYSPANLIETNLCLLNNRIKKILFARDFSVIGSTKVNRKTYLKFTLLNPMTQMSDIKNIITTIEKIGKEQIKSSLVNL